MSNGASPKDFIQLLYRLQKQEAARLIAHPSSSERSFELDILKRWQSDRLRKTYADFLEDPQYRPACEFFLTELYAPQDFSQRDQDAERLYAVLRRYLPESALTLLLGAITLNHLTDKLDLELLDALLDDQVELQTLTVEQYAKAYRKCDNFDERRSQIELLVALLRQAALGGRSLLFQIALRLAKAPAVRLGWQDLYQFLEIGAAACKPIPDVDYFVSSIQTREMTILDRMATNHPLPIM
jgi:hypothetical protein